VQKIDVNLTPAEREARPDDLRRTVTALLRAQRPVAGTSRRLNVSLVRQFRLPGYPLVMISTDLLQEGEDLHTFCSTVHHYGLAWTPSALEQRTGRVDRVRSQSERRLTALDRPPTGAERLQVHYPHLVDSVERIQVRRVLRRMDEFIRLMHTDLAVVESGDGRVDIARELLEPDLDMPQPPGGVLESAFDVRPDLLHGDERALAVDEQLAGAQLGRFARLTEQVAAQWEPRDAPDLLLGTVRLDGGRIQPFSLQLGWWQRHLVVRCVSPVGLIDATGAALEALAASCQRGPLNVAMVEVAGGTYNATVEEDVLLGAEQHDGVRVAALVRRVTAQADELEHEHLAVDQALDRFAADLGTDYHHARR
jgi:hypothetical protein